MISILIHINTIQNVPEPIIPASLEPWVAPARHYAEAARARNTMRAYDADWRDFAAWCDSRQCPALPAEGQTLALYLTHLAADRGLRPSTIQRRLVAINHLHEISGLPSPTLHPAVRSVHAGIRRQHRTAPVSKAPLLVEQLRLLLDQAAVRTPPLRALRDRALLLTGFAGALRRSELVALRHADLEFVAEGLVLRIPTSKSDPEGRGQLIGIPFGHHSRTCPVRALAEWLERAAITEGPIFRPISRGGRLGHGPLNDHRVAQLIKELCAAAGLDPAPFAGHSLRSGFATTAARAGVHERAIMQQTRHISLATLRRYIHRGGLFSANAAAQLGL